MLRLTKNRSSVLINERSRARSGQLHAVFGRATGVR